MGVWKVLPRLELDERVRRCRRDKLPASLSRFRLSDMSVTDVLETQQGMRTVTLNSQID